MDRIHDARVRAASKKNDVRASHAGRLQTEVHQLHIFDQNLGAVCKIQASPSGGALPINRAAGDGNETEGGVRRASCKKGWHALVEFDCSLQNHAGIGLKSQRAVANDFWCGEAEHDNTRRALGARRIVLGLDSREG